MTAPVWNSRAGAQLSYEFLVYVVVSAASLAIALGLYSAAQGVQAARSASAYGEELAAQINANMHYSASSFEAYLQGWMCNASVSDYTLVTARGTYQLQGQLQLADGALCVADDGAASLHIERLYNGTYLLSR